MRVPSDSQEVYEDKKEYLKAKKKRLAARLQSASGPAYAAAVQAYQQAKDELDQHYRANCGPRSTRAERRIAWLRRRGIKPVWSD